MKFGSYFPAWVVFVLLLASCKKNTNETTVVTPAPSKKAITLGRLNWFLGAWENTTAEADMRENWEKENDSLYRSESYVTVGKDTVFHEWIELTQRKDSIFYIVSVKNQNKEKPVTFYATKVSTTEVVFENPKHDFPTKISYKKITSDSLVAEISGVLKGKPAREQYPMKKSKT